MKDKILMADDSAPFRADVTNRLKKLGYDVTEAKTAEEALALMGRERFGLAIVDRKFDNALGAFTLMSGDDLVLAARNEGIITPIMILTAYPDPKSLNDDFQNGAVEYLAKTCDPIELVARVRARFHPTEPINKVLRVGALVLDTGTRKLTYHGKEILLQPIHYQILALLMDAPEHRMTLDNIVMSVYGHSHAVRSEVVENSISRLNKPFRAANFGRVIQYRKELGYVLIVK